MNVGFHLFIRELRGRSYFLLGAALLGLLPLMWAARLDRGETIIDLRLQFARLLVGLVLAGLPLFWGARWLVKGAGAAGSRSFELAQPLTAWQLTAAKLSAMVAITLGSAFLIGLPTALADPGLARRGHLYLFDLLFSANRPDTVVTHAHLVLPVRFSDAQWLLCRAAGLPLLLFAPLVLAQSVSFAAASRGRQALADFGCWLLFAAAAGVAVDRLLGYGALGFLLGWLPLLCLALAVLGIWSAWRSFAAGALLANAHRGHSAVMNPGLLVLGLLLMAGAFGATRPDVAALESFSLVSANADGSLWLIGGRQRDSAMSPLLLVEPATGKTTFAAPLLQLNFYSVAVAERAAFAVVGRQDGRLERLLVRPGKASVPRPFDLFASWSSGERFATDASGLFEVTMNYEFVVTVREQPGGRERFRIPLPKGPSDSLVQLKNRQGSIFDVVIALGLQDLEHQSFARYQLDATDGTFAREDLWRTRLNGSPAGLEAWWQEALPLAAAGVPLDVLADFEELLPLTGDGVFLAREHRFSSDLDGRRYTIVNGRGACTGALVIPHGAFVSGEIRPGLLLVGISDGDIDAAYDFHRPRGANAFAAWSTWVVEVPQGRIVRRLRGFAPSHPMTDSRRTFLLGPYGEPYDLPAADAEPRRILPWRPLPAAKEDGG